ncbi:MAG: UrcA family protein [Phenylobacterium sp.]
MSRFTKTVAAFATLALATAPMMTVATGAQAAPVQVKVADIDLNSTPGVSAFRQRGEVAAKTFCRDREVGEGVRGMHAHKVCISGVKAELQDKLVPAQRAQLASRAAYASR